jgi:hypothetical protein
MLYFIIYVAQTNIKKDIFRVSIELYQHGSIIMNINTACMSGRVACTGFVAVFEILESL